MVKIDLITGFLGAGKTTFLKNYARYLMSRGESLGILENDYGAVNVDMMLLQELEGDRCELEMVAGGCCSDCHKRRFKTKLIAMGMCGYDRILVEPSGIFDVDEFFDTLREEPLDRWYEIGNVITVVDSLAAETLSETAAYLLASESANAGLVVLSKTQLLETEKAEEKLEEVRTRLNRALESISCRRRFEKEELLSTPWEAYTDADYRRIMNSGYRTEDHVKQQIDEKTGFKTLYYMNLPDQAEEAEKKIRTAFEDPECGEIFRIKGFLKGEDGSWYELNATREIMQRVPVREGQNVLILIGENLNEHCLEQYFKESGVL